jgi:hypothetical protein
VTDQFSLIHVLRVRRERAFGWCVERKLQDREDGLHLDLVQVGVRATVPASVLRERMALMVWGLRRLSRGRRRASGRVRCRGNSILLLFEHLELTGWTVSVHLPVCRVRKVTMDQVPPVNMPKYQLSEVTIGCALGRWD